MNGCFKDNCLKPLGDSSKHWQESNLQLWTMKPPSYHLLYNAKKKGFNKKKPKKKRKKNEEYFFIIFIKKKIS